MKKLFAFTYLLFFFWLPFSIVCAQAAGPTHPLDPLSAEEISNVVNTDVQVWYTVGTTHIPRMEEWPVMPVTHLGFKMITGGFFSGNPALDVPKYNVE